MASNVSVFTQIWRAVGPVACAGSAGSLCAAEPRHLAVERWAGRYLSSLHPPSVLWLRHRFHASDWLTLPCFLCLQWLERLFSGVSAGRRQASAGEPAAASRPVGEAWITSVTWESEKEAFPVFFLMVFLYITLRFSPNFLLFRLPLEWDCQSDVCLSPKLPWKHSSLSLAAF